MPGSEPFILQIRRGPSTGLPFFRAASSSRRPFLHGSTGKVLRDFAGIAGPEAACYQWVAVGTADAYMPQR